MKVWIDDERDPKDHLKNENINEIIHIKEIRKALNFVIHEKSNEIETLYLDNWMDENILTGHFLLHEVLMTIKYEMNENNVRVFPKLKKIYLHSSDEDAVCNELDNLSEEFQKFGIELKKADY